MEENVASEELFAREVQELMRGERKRARATTVDVAARILNPPNPKILYECMGTIALILWKIYYRVT